MLENILITCLILSFAALFAIVVYFRFKVLHAYGILYENRVDFTNTHIFNPKKMQEEIIPKYPKFEKELKDYSFGIRFSMKMVTVFMVLITAFGGALILLKQS